MIQKDIIGENARMKRLKGRILMGTAAVAAALTIGGCSPNQNANTAEESNTAATAKTASTIRDFEKFDVNENYNNVVYGPPPER